MEINPDVQKKPKKNNNNKKKDELLNELSWFFLL